MGRVVVTEFMSLDGVIEAPGGGEDYEHAGWSFKFNRGEEGDKFKLDELMAADAQLLGRVTYEGFAKAWPSMTDMGLFGGCGDQILHRRIGRSVEHPRRVLQIHQHDVDAAALHHVDALAHQFAVSGKAVPAQHGIRADLPDRQIGMERDNVAGKTGEFLGRVFAALALALTVLSGVVLALVSLTLALLASLSAGHAAEALEPLGLARTALPLLADELAQLLELLA